MIILAMLLVKYIALCVQYIASGSKHNSCPELITVSHCGFSCDKLSLLTDSNATRTLNMPCACYLLLSIVHLPCGLIQRLGRKFMDLKLMFCLGNIQSTLSVHKL